MVKSPYVPDQGDIVWMNFDPTLGHEQKGKRPALVLSPKIYNQKSRLCIVVPITSTVRTYPFVVNLGTSHQTKGVVLVDQLKTIDWFTRKLEYVEKVNKKIVKDVQEKIKLIIL